MLTKKIICYTTPLFFIITASTFALYNYLYYSTIPAYQKKLVVMAHDRAEEINTYLNNQEKNAVQLSEETTIIDMLKNKNSSPARPEPVEGYPRALEDSLQQVQTERKDKKNSEQPL